MKLPLALLIPISVSACRSTAETAPPRAAPTSRHAYRFSPTRTCPPVTIDTSNFPDGANWGALARDLIHTWYPRICELLSTDSRDPLTNTPHGAAFNARSTIHVVLEPKLDVPAYTAGNSIHVNGPWITSHPDDSGLLIHELAHVIQRYPARPTTPSWLIEGIADYVRWWRYEPELAATAERTRIDARSNYTDSYRTTAMWLAWCSRKHDMRLVPALDLALRNGEDPQPVFERVCGKDAAALWAEFSAEWR